MKWKLGNANGRDLYSYDPRSCIMVLIKSSGKLGLGHGHCETLPNLPLSYDYRLIMGDIYETARMVYLGDTP